MGTCMWSYYPSSLNVLEFPLFSIQLIHLWMLCSCFICWLHYLSGSAFLPFIVNVRHCSSFRKTWTMPYMNQRRAGFIMIVVFLINSSLHWTSLNCCSTPNLLHQSYYLVSTVLPLCRNFAFNQHVFKCSSACIKHMMDRPATNEWCTWNKDSVLQPGPTVWSMQRKRLPC